MASGPCGEKKNKTWRDPEKKEKQLAS